MNKKVIAVLLSLAIFATACGSGTPQTVEVTRVVEVTKVVVATAAAPAATVAPAATAAAPAPAGFGETLKKVKARGKLVCGVNDQVPGFGFLDKGTGAFTGFDVDFCKALAAAVFGDATKVEYRAVTAAQRFPALQSGEIDVLIRNTTRNLTRDTDNTGNFVSTTFYDGQGIMVPTKLKVAKLADLKGATICVQTGTTTGPNLAEYMAANKVDYKPLVVDTADAAIAAYEAGRCDAFTTDKSGLSARISTLKTPADTVILDLTLSKEPLGPMVRHGDDQWFDIMQWTVFTTILAEEFGITSANVADVKAKDARPEVKRLTGADANAKMGAKLGLGDDFAFNIIKQVGNYAEIYDRNLGPKTKTAIPRGLNNLYTNGGLLYAPPFN